MHTEHTVFCFCIVAIGPGNINHYIQPYNQQRHPSPYDIMQISLSSATMTKASPTNSNKYLKQISSDPECVSSK